MGLNEKLDAEGFLTSLRVIQRSLSLFVTGLSAPLLEQYGTRGLDALDEAFYRWGKWRGERLRRSPETMSNGLRPDILIENWDSPDLVLSYADNLMTPHINGSDVELAFATLPFADQLTGSLEPVLDSLYRRTGDGMAEAFNPHVDIGWAPFGSGTNSRLRLSTLQFDAPAASVDPGRVLLDPVAAIGLMRRSAVSNGGFYSAVAQVAIERFDATGEHLIREGLRNIGRLRGETIRARHLAQGKELTIENLMNDWDGPLVSVWTFGDEGTLTADRWEQDCTYCPYAAAWADFGSRGLELGYMYDVEMHTAVYSAYHPGITVRWEKLKTRGDATCNFRLHLDSGPVPVVIGNRKEEIAS